VVSRETLVFGHDGHGSVRVLFDLAGAIAQLYVYEAYGQLAAIYNAAGQFVSANPSDALTAILHNGEPFDIRIQMEYLRQRWYEVANGRFNRADPFFGNLQDPLSFHKYLFTHGDPVNGIDPTGRQTLVSTLATTALRYGLYGAAGGAVLGAIDGALDFNSGRPLGERILRGALKGAFYGFIAGAAAGGLFGALPFLATAGALANIAWGLGAALWLALTGYFTAMSVLESIQNGNYYQAAFRFGTGVAAVILFVVMLDSAPPTMIPAPRYATLAELGVPRDAWIHLSTAEPAALQSGVRAQTHWVRTNDVLHMTPEQYRAAVAGSGAPSASSSARTFIIKRAGQNDSAIFRPWSERGFADIQEFRSQEVIQPDMVIIDPGRPSGGTSR
jgi:RHS repeat-associated protein